MPHLAWLVLFLPFLCGCEQCDWSWVCFTVAGMLAAGLFLVLALVRELVLLSLLRQ